MENDLRFVHVAYDQVLVLFTGTGFARNLKSVEVSFQFGFAVLYEGGCD